MTEEGAPLELFLAHSVALESEAGERYRELEATMRGHNNTEVADFFRRMGDEAEKHLGEIEGYTAGRQLPAIPAWEFQWPEAEPPETISYEAVHYRMSLSEAITLALANERAAKDYYARVAEQTAHPETATLAASFAAEEAEHEAALIEILQHLPPGPELHRLEDDEPHMPD